MKTNEIVIGMNSLYEIEDERVGIDVVVVDRETYRKMLDAIGKARREEIVSEMTMAIPGIVSRREG